MVLVLVNAIFLFPSVRAIEAGVSTLQLEIASRARSVLEVALQGLAIEERRLADSIGVDPSRTNEAISNFLRDHVSFDEVSVILSSGQESIRQGRENLVPASELENRSAEPGFNEALKGNIYFGPVEFLGKAEPIQEIFVPVFSSSRKVTSVISGKLNLKFLHELVSSIKVGKRGRVYVVDKSGNLIADPNPALVVRGRNLLFRQAVKKVISQSEVVDGLVTEDRYRDFEERNVFVAGVPIEALGWGLFVEQPLEDAFEARNRTVNLGIISFVVSALLIALLGFNMRELVRVAKDLNRERHETLAIISNLTDGLIEYDDNFTILMINDSAQKMLGIREEEVLGRRFSAQDIAQPGLASFLQVLFPILSPSSHVLPSSSGQPKTVELKLHEPLERDVQVVTISIPDPERGITTYLKIMHDVTRERSIDRSKSEFISIAAHQLRTPLSAIKWTLRLVLDGDLGEITPTQVDFLRKAYETNERMIRLVSDLLDVARIEEGRFGYTFAMGNILQLIEKIILGLRSVADEKKISLELEKPDVPAPEIKFDLARISLVLQNLLENGIHYTPPEGKITVRVSQDADFLKVSVSDTGVGIPRHQLKRLFTKFFRGENVVRLQTEGSGLGLFIVRNIIQRHGGEVSVISEEGKGSTFSFTLPLREELIPTVVEAFVAF